MKLLISLIFNNWIFVNLYKLKHYYIERELKIVKGKLAVSKIKYRGKDLRVHGNLVLKSPEMLKIGDYVRIGEGCFFSCSGGLHVGNNVQFSRNIVIYTNTHDIESSCIPYDNSYIYKPVKIGDSAWIGMNVVVAPGTQIGEGAVVGMGAVVSGEIPPYSIVVGEKHRIIGYRDKSSYLDKKNKGLLFGKVYPDN